MFACSHCSHAITTTTCHHQQRICWSSFSLTRRRRFPRSRRLTTYQVKAVLLLGMSTHSPKTWCRYALMPSEHWDASWLCCGHRQQWLQNCTMIVLWCMDSTPTKVVGIWGVLAQNP
eukprot:SAG22_NODE_1240_length_5042_cov_103.645964_10_plen_117_part_00